MGVLATVRGRPVEAPFELQRAFAGLRRLRGHAALDRGDPPAPVGPALAQPAAAGTRPRARGGGREPVLRARDRTRAHRRHDPRRRPARAPAREPARPRGGAAELAAGAGPRDARRRGGPGGTLGHAAGAVRSECGRRHRVRRAGGACSSSTATGSDSRIPCSHPSATRTMPLHRRRELHRRLAALDVDPEERARHLAIAAAGPDEEIAAALDCGGRARRRPRRRPGGGRARRPRGRPDSTRARPTCSAGGASPLPSTGSTRATGRRQRTLLEEAVDSAEPGPVASRCSLRARTGRRGDGGLSDCGRRSTQRALAEPGLAIRQQRVHHLRARLAGDGARRQPRGSPPRRRGARAGRAAGRADLLVIGLVTVAEIAFWRTGRIRRDLLDRASAIERSSGGERRGLAAQDLARRGRHPADHARLAARPIRPSRRSARPLASS